MSAHVGHYGDPVCIRRTELWRVISWCVGDAHANRICRLLDLYCWVFRIDPTRFWRWPR